MNQELKKPELLTKEELEELLPELGDLEEWIKKVKDYALAQAIAGEKIKGFKLVEGRSVAKYKDERALIRRLEANGYQKAIFYKSPELISVSDLKKILKRDFANYEDLIEKPQGKLTLVPETDKRPAFEPEGAKGDFADDIKQGSKAADTDDLI